MLMLCFGEGICQEDSYTFESAEYNFSFLCPKNWQFVEEMNFMGDGLKGYFISKNPAEAKIYNDCYEGKVFYLEVFDKSLDYVLLNKSYTYRDRKYYPASNFMTNESRPAADIKGNGWTGIHHINSCKVSCVGDNTGAIVEGCEYLYFSRGHKTICFSTTGKAFNEEVRRKIIVSFTFLSDF